jgi:hypothetical protein
VIRILSPKVQAEISALIEAATKAGSLVRVYGEAEKIRQANITDNLALEDIVEEIIARSAAGPGYEADPADAVSALLGSDEQDITKGELPTRSRAQ